MSVKLTNFPFFLTPVPPPPPPHTPLKLHWIFQAPYSIGGVFQYLALPLWTVSLHVRTPFLWVRGDVADK